MFTVIVSVFILMGATALVATGVIKAIADKKIALGETSSGWDEAVSMAMTAENVVMVVLILLGVACGFAVLLEDKEVIDLSARERREMVMLKVNNAVLESENAMFKKQLGLEDPEPLIAVEKTVPAQVLVVPGATMKKEVAATSKEPVQALVVPSAAHGLVHERIKEPKRRCPKNCVVHGVHKHTQEGK